MPWLQGATGPGSMTGGSWSAGRPLPSWAWWDLMAWRRYRKAVWACRMRGPRSRRRRAPFQPRGCSPQRGAPTRQVAGPRQAVPRCRAVRPEARPAPHPPRSSASRQSSSVAARPTPMTFTSSASTRPGLGLQGQLRASGRYRGRLMGRTSPEASCSRASRFRWELPHRASGKGTSTMMSTDR